MRKLLFVLTVLFLSKNAIAQDTAIFHFATTRGSNAEGNLLVPKGKAQVEVGVTYNYFKNYHTSLSLYLFYIDIIYMIIKI